jgi:adenine-specific DNA-methyltransferase
VSRLNDLLRRLDAAEPELAKDLRRAVGALADRRAFGLNFERHVPEAVELPGRPVRKGDKVRILAPRGSKFAYEDERLWRVVAITKSDDGVRTASLELLAGGEETTAMTDDLVVVAEFRDPIYPGLVSTGKVERGGDKPFHTVINAENYHALQTLLFTHRGKVDCIYIDPPYNTGAKDWKYNNDYVDGDDLYRHSKWLAFMERRLLLARDLLNPNESVLIVTIDEKEYLRLGLLLEQVFSDATIQMISSVINPKGSSRGGRFARSDEYIFVVFLGGAQATPAFMSGAGGAPKTAVRWAGLQRQGANGRRSARPNLFYPIFMRPDGSVHSVGDSMPASSRRDSAMAPAGTTATWPISNGGGEATWGLDPAALRAKIANGTAKPGRYTPGSDRCAWYHLQSGILKQIELGEVLVEGRAPDGSLVVRYAAAEGKRPTPTTAWNNVAHSASEYGSTLLSRLLPDRKFPFPKSLYAVEDILRFFVADKPCAIVVDFFAGSGTTTHAVMRLNRQDGGARTSIAITNNEVSAEDRTGLMKNELRPGDPDWEQLGIFDYVTKPRIMAAATGRTPSGTPVDGNYRFTDEFPIEDGLAENVEFLTLVYEAPLRVSSNLEFYKVAPLLWMRAGSRGRRIEDVSAGWDVADSYGVIADLNQSGQFLKAVAASETISHAFIVTDEDRLFEAVVRELPEGVEPVRLYEAYLRNFEIETGRSAL